MNKYEILLVLPGTLTDEEAALRSKEVSDLVSEHGSEVSLAAMGKNRLAYPIKLIRYGYFYTIVFSAEAPTVLELRKKLGLLRDVLRAMISHFRVAYSDKPKPMETTRRPDVPKEEKTAVITPTWTDKAPQPVIQRAVPAPSVAERPIDEADLEKISKKLDDLIEGDMIPGE
jgi:ribosomal protein S6